jgi:hypothetical protein
MVNPEDVLEYCPECDATVVIYSVYESECVYWKCSKCHHIVDFEQNDYDDIVENYPDF